MVGPSRDDDGDNNRTSGTRFSGDAERTDRRSRVGSDASKVDRHNLVGGDAERVDRRSNGTGVCEINAHATSLCHKRRSHPQPPKFSVGILFWGS